MSGRLITLAVTELQYEGDSVGNDLTLAVELGGGRLEINKRAHTGERVAVNRSFAQFRAESAVVSLAGSVQIVERDPIFNESGQTPLTWTLDATTIGPQQTEIPVAVTVAELGGNAEGASARFVVLIRATVVSTARYIPETDDGWLTVLLEESRQRVSLPEALRVEIIREVGGREYFRIEEGPFRGKYASVSWLPDGASRLSAADPRTPAITLTYSISGKELRLGTQTFQSTDDPSSPLTKGVYDIEIPDAPHRGGLSYPEAKRARTWFRIGHRGDRYIHTGRASAGCITITERARWDNLARLLVKARKGDGVSVGTLKVIE